MNRQQKREDIRKRKKIAKRGPNVSDFHIHFTVENNLPYIALDEMQKLLPKSLFDIIKQEMYENKTLNVVTDKATGDGLFTGDCGTIFTNVKNAVRIRKQELSTQHFT